MPFFKELRRRSKASFRTSDSSNESSATVPTTKSSSTLNSALGSSTPPSTYHTNGSNNNLGTLKTNGDSGAPPVPPRPTVIPMSNRNSMIVREHWQKNVKNLSLLTWCRHCHPRDLRRLCEYLYRRLPLLPRSHPSLITLSYVMRNSWYWRG
jgi:hypothetical protein